MLAGVITPSFVDTSMVSVRSCVAITGSRSCARSSGVAPMTVGFGDAQPTTNRAATMNRSDRAMEHLLGLVDRRRFVAIRRAIRRDRGAGPVAVPVARVVLALPVGHEVA